MTKEIIAAVDVKACKFCQAKITSLVSFRTGRSYDVNVNVFPDGSAEAVRNDFHFCPQRQAAREAMANDKGPDQSVIADGRYTIVHQDGSYQTFRIKTVKQGGLKDKRIISFKQGTRFEGVAFLTSAGKAAFWQRAKYVWPNAQLDVVSQAIETIVQNPQAAGLAYALKENCCYRCGKELTVPASIHQGMGPECAKKAVTRQANRTVFHNLHQQAVATPAPIPQASNAYGPSDIEEEMAMNKMVQDAELKQHQAAYEEKLQRDLALGN